MTKRGGARQGAGRPRKPAPTGVLVKLDAEQLKFLDEQCKAQGIKRATFLRELLVQVMSDGWALL